MRPNPPLTFVVDADSNTELARFDVVSNRASVSFSPDGQYLVASAFTRTGSGAPLGFRVWRVGEWQIASTYPGEPDDDLGVIDFGVVADRGLAVAYGRRGAIEMRSLVDDRVVWTAPLLPSQFAPPTPEVLRTELDRVAIAPNGEFLVSYESPVATSPISHVSGAIVLRDTADGSVIAVHDVYGLTGLSIAPDSRSYAYATGAGAAHIALVRVDE